MSRNFALLSLLTLSCFACSDEGKKTIKVSTKLRSTGNASFELRSNSQGISLNQASNFLANSTVAVDSFEVPISRINLTAGDSGSGYTVASPNFYTCNGSSNEDCMVDLVKTDINDLLGSNSEQSIEFNEVVTYTGTAVEICADGQGGEGSKFIAKLTASAVLGNTTYYTNATSGVSTTGPAEATEIEMSCLGRLTKLVVPITVQPETNVDLVFWAEPAGTVLITNDGKYVNANCTASSHDGVAFCTTLPAFFGTTVGGDASAEKFLLDVSTVPTNSPNSVYADMLATAIYDSEGTVFGGNLKQIFTNTEGEIKLMHAPMFEFTSISEINGKLSYKYLDDTGTDVAVIEDLSSSGNSTGLKISRLVEEEVSFNSTKL